MRQQSVIFQWHQMVITSLLANVITKMQALIKRNMLLNLKTQKTIRFIALSQPNQVTLLGAQIAKV